MRHETAGKNHASRGIEPESYKTISIMSSIDYT